MIKTLLSEVERRHKKCSEKFGATSYYSIPPDLFDKYHSEKKYNKNEPFNVEKCINVDPKKLKKDKDKLTFVDIKSQKGCDKVKGFWSSNGINRSNFVEKGVCFVEQEDRKCSMYNDNELIKAFNKKSTSFAFPSSIANANLKCSKNKICSWNPSKNECYSVKTFEGKEVIPKLPKSWPDNITIDNFQNYLNQYYSKLLDKFPQSYTPLFGTGNRCIGYQAMKISQPQTVINMIFKGFAEKNSSNRGMIVWHGTGSGKTCTAAGIMEAFWSTDKNIVYLSTVEALAVNPPVTFHKCMHLFPRFKGKTIEDIEQDFKIRGIRFFTFAQLSHFLLIHRGLKVQDSKIDYHKNFLKNAVLIIDEAHNIFNPLPNQRNEHFALRDFLINYKNETTSNLTIAILTATPGNKPEDVVNLLNLVRDRNSKPIKIPDTDDLKSIEAFGRKIKGLISYFNMNADLTKYPKIINQPKNLIPMTLHQYKIYAEVLSKMDKKFTDWETLQEQEKHKDYYGPARKYENTLYNFEEDITLEEFSCKLPVLLQQINKYKKEKHYVYSAFYENRGFGGHGVRAIASFLESELDFEQISFKTARNINEGKEPMLKPAKRYILAITTVLSPEKERHSVGENLKELMKIFNHPDNKNGQYIQVFLASQKFNEGLDFKDLRNIHIFEPFLEYSHELQTIGRAARYCSHSNLDLENWDVKIHKYIAEFPLELKSKGDEIKQLEMDRKEILDLLEDFQLELDEIKGLRNVKEERDEIKKNIFDAKAELRDLEKQIKEEIKFSAKNIIMVGNQMEQEIKERMKTQFIILQTLKEYAVDCQLFSKFHAQINEIYSCKS